MATGQRILYTLLLHLLLPLVAVYLVLRCLRERGYCRGWRQRFGGGPGRAGDGPTGRPLWVHAASVGEVRAAAPLIRGLRQRYPECEVLVTTTTPTGAAQVAAAFGSGVRHAYLPLDLPWAVAAFLRRWRPRLAVVMEMEFWPNLFHAVRRHRIPLMLANARLSAKSARRYARLRPLVAATLGCPDVIAAQNDNDARRLRALGAPGAVLTVTGSVKFDQPVPETALEDGAALREALGGADRPVWIAASTREGEEEAVLAAHEQLRESHPTALLLLVPRHPQRFDGVAALCRERGHALARRSEEATPGPETAVYLGDSMGELATFYAAADVAFVGGSLVPSGAQNMLEPAALGRPVLLGPSDFNFAAIARTLEAQGALRRVSDAAGLARAVASLLDDPARRQRMASEGHNLIRRNRGATERLLERIADLTNGTEGT